MPLPLSLLRDPPKILSVYRNCLREIRFLPHLYLRQFFKIKARDDVEAILRCHSQRIAHIRLHRMEKEVLKLKGANHGHVKAFDHILDLAYGRKGKFKWELLEPIITTAHDPIQPKIIKALEKSRPPVYSPVLTSLLRDPVARKVGRPIKPNWSPSSILPPRADPQSEEARLLGPFSKRREVNIRWRHFKKSLGSVYPPLEVPTKTEGTPDVAETKPTLAIQDWGLLQDIEDLIGPNPSPQLTRKEKAQLPATQKSEEPSKLDKRHPSLWVRRRYRSLALRLPIVTRTPPSKDKNAVQYETRMIDKPTVKEVDAGTLAWLERDARKQKQHKATKKVQKNLPENK